MSLVVFSKPHSYCPAHQKKIGLGRLAYFFIGLAYLVSLAKDDVIYEMGHSMFGMVNLITKI